MVQWFDLNEDFAMNVERTMLFVRMFFFFAAFVASVLAIGFLGNDDWATWIWPFYTYQMSRIFIASILLAIAAPVLVIGLSREWAAARGGALNLAVMFVIMAVYALATSQSTAVTLFGLAAAGSAVFQIGLFIGTTNIQFNDTRPTPQPVLWSFGLFAAVLIVVGCLLLARVNNILPWSVTNDLSVLYGSIFLGAAAFFLYGIYARVWGAARGPLCGFLAYDLVLIVPFLALYPNISDRFKTSLTIYIAVLIYSGALAIFYLLKGPSAENVESRL